MGVLSVSMFGGLSGIVPNLILWEQFANENAALATCIGSALFGAIALPLLVFRNIKRNKRGRIPSSAPQAPAPGMSDLPETPKPQRKHSGVWLSVVIALLVGATAAILTPSFVKARATSQQNACINNLRQIDSAKEQWALAANKRNGDPVYTLQVNSYLKGNITPVCPAGGRYTYHRVGEDPTCSRPGHRLPRR